MKLQKYCIIMLLTLTSTLLSVPVPTSAQSREGQQEKKKNIIIKDSVNLNEVLVQARRTGVSANSVSAQIDNATIHRCLGKSLASMLENVSGVSSIQTGTIIAKPVIQGMYGNRILTINQGARLTGQQWGADHAPEVDQNSSSTIEVVKGAESVKYGAEALGGIIVMEQRELPFGQDHIGGSLTSLYGTNGKRYSLSGNIEGTLPFCRDIAWRLQGTHSNGGDRKTARYLLNNTGMREHDFSLNAGYRHGRLTMEAYYSLFDQKLGIMPSAQMGSEDVLKKRIELGRPIETDPFSRHIDYPNQHITHHTATAKAAYNLGRWGRMTYQLTYQNDKRTENRIRRMNHSNIPAVSLHLSSLQNSLKWKTAYGAWSTEAGADFAYTENHSQAGTGVVPVIPNYTESTFGIYTIQKYSHDRWGSELGIRFDGQRTKAAGYDWTGNFYGGQRSFSNLTYSLGGRYQATRHLSIVSNFGLAWRAPHVYELYSNGNELGSGMFTIGDSTMNSERSYKWITSLRYRSQRFEATLDAFLQWIDNYIYDEPTHETTVVISGAYPTFRYKQTRALFRGIDADLHIKPTDWLEYHCLAALIWANERTTGNYLPYIPSARVSNELTWKPEGSGKHEPWITLKHRFTAKQNRFNPATDLISYTPPAYHLFGLEAGISFPLKGRQKLSAMVAADNLLNKEYKEYTNRARYYAHDMGRDIRLNLNWTF
ncbi:TonB-dependent receptor [Prevotella sp. oral taxon 376]|uniref:TonB-dependent receptor n=1 Tax=Prevotella sp. oral taxon 376 TaxID=712466 RepID=UPI001E3AB996|nr:TonB-dependent receptor [Prevotella sp. oral taxon 376]